MMSEYQHQCTDTVEILPDSYCVFSTQNSLVVGLKTVSWFSQCPLKFCVVISGLYETERERKAAVY